MPNWTREDGVSVYDEEKKMAPGEKSCRCPGCGTCDAHDLYPALKAEALVMKTQLKDVRRIAMGMAVLHAKKVGGNQLPAAQLEGLRKLLKVLGVEKEDFQKAMAGYGLSYP
jgi:hypothetical protein